MLHAMQVGSPRSYSSPLRAEQAATTVDRIVDAAVRLLQSGDPGAIAMQDVADSAGVSLRTVYRAFPTKVHLFDGVLDTLKLRFEAVAGAAPTTAEELRSSIGPAVCAVYELETLYRALFATAAGREAHRRGAAERQASVELAFADDLAGLSDEQTRRFGALMHLVTSSRGALFLKDYAGLDVESASAAVSWAVDALVAAVRDPGLRAQLGPANEAER